MKQVARNAGEFIPGHSADTIDWQGTKVGVSICYDAIYPGQTRSLVDGGAEVMVHLTNDAWYGDTSAPRQLLRASRFRAAESGRPVVRAALTGISAMIEPSGRVSEFVELGSAGVLRKQVLTYRHLTFYQRFPRLVPWLALAWVGFVIVVSGRGVRPVRAAGE